MELNSSTFILEIINFFVLVWIVKHFLYQPVKSILEKRQQNIEQALQQASEQRDEAAELESQFKSRLDEWALEKQQMKDALLQELQEERAKGIEALQQELADESERQKVATARQLEENNRQYQRVAREQAAKFTTQLLGMVAGPELEARLLDVFIQALPQLDEERRQRILHACKAGEEDVSVSSAFELNQQQREQLQSGFTQLCGKEISLQFSLEPELMAGLRVAGGEVVLGLNLKDELNGFVELSRDYE